MCAVCCALLPPPFADLPESFFLPPEEERKALDLLKPNQLAAVNYVVQEATKQSNSARSDLESRFRSLGYGQRDLRKTLRFIRDDAPLVIHFNPATTLKHFVSDTHYRNQFETSTSGGSVSFALVFSKCGCVVGWRVCTEVHVTPRPPCRETCPCAAVKKAKCSTARTKTTATRTTASSTAC